MPEPDQKRPDEPRASNFSGRSAGGTAREECYLGTNCLAFMLYLPFSLFELFWGECISKSMMLFSSREGSSWREVTQKIFNWEGKTTLFAT